MRGKYRHRSLATSVKPQEREQLVKLMEECAEVIHAVSKILRHGWHSTNPDAPGSETNYETLQRELHDLEHSIAEVAEARDL